MITYFGIYLVYNLEHFGIFYSAKPGNPGGALDVDDCRKSETFLFCNEPTFLRAELAETAVMFFRSVQLSNLISRNFYYHAMQQYRYFNFSDVFWLNYIFVIDAAVKQLVSRSFLKYGASAVTMAAHKIKKKIKSSL